MSTGRGAVAVFRGWKGNRRSGHASQDCDISTHGFNSFRMGNEQPASTPLEVYTTIYFTFISSNR